MAKVVDLMKNEADWYFLSSEDWVTYSGFVGAVGDAWNDTNGLGGILEEAGVEGLEVLPVTAMPQEGREDLGAAAYYMRFTMPSDPEKQAVVTKWLMFYSAWGATCIENGGMRVFVSVDWNERNW